MRGTFHCLLAVVLVLAGSAGLAAGHASLASGASIDGVAYAGEDAVTFGSGLSLWRTGDHAFAVTVRSSEPAQYRVCLAIRPQEGNGSTRLDCTAAWVNGTAQVTVTVGDLPANGPRSRVLVASLHASSTNETVARTKRPVTVYARQGDVDGDGLANEREVALSTSPTGADTDGDGLGDGVEVNTHGTDPANTDTDGDGLSDSIEVNTYQSNPTDPDTDTDGLTDGAEVNRYGTNTTTPDTDTDGLTDGEEVNKYGTSPTTTDTDHDGLDDGAEVNVHETSPTTADTDGDGLADAAEVNEYGTNPVDADTDGDGLGDGVEVNTHGTDPASTDTDGDGRSDAKEVRAGTDPNGATGPRKSASAFTVLSPWTARAAVVAVVAVAAAVGLWTRSARVRSIVPGGDADDATGAEDLPGPTEAARDDGTEAEGEDAYDRLSDEKRVLALLEEHGGHLPQSRIVEETCWSKSKVSRMLSRMDDAGTVRKIALGRQNLIALPGEVPEAAQPPEEPDPATSN